MFKLSVTLLPKNINDLSHTNEYMHAFNTRCKIKNKNILKNYILQNIRIFKKLFMITFISKGI